MRHQYSLNRDFTLSNFESKDLAGSVFDDGQDLWDETLYLLGDDEESDRKPSFVIAVRWR
jgi:hypothetical protein